MSNGLPGPADIQAARRRITRFVRRTPLSACGGLARPGRREVLLKHEYLQPSGSFKIRGAANAILIRRSFELARGVVTYSTGSHGRAVSWIARGLGFPATVCVSEHITPAKAQAFRNFQCFLDMGGPSQDAAAARAREFAADSGMVLVDPIDDPEVIAGHGTIGLELLEDAPDLDTVVVPVSGGALITGIALVLKAANPDIRVIGVSMERGAAMFLSQQAGHPVEVPEASSLADSLQGGIGLDNRYTFRAVYQLVDDIVLVSEDEIADAMAFALLHEGLVIEGAAATTLAALLYRAEYVGGTRIAAILTGNSVDPGLLANLARKRGDRVAALFARGAGAPAGDGRE